jgi:hypothetical protein
MKRRFTAAALAAGAALSLGLVPSATANHLPVGVEVNSARLGPGGSVILSGTIECPQGSSYDVGGLIRQRSGKRYNQAYIEFSSVSGECSGGPQEWVSSPSFGEGPFHSGRAVADVTGSIFDPYTWDFSSERDIQELRVTK